MVVSERSKVNGDRHALAWLENVEQAQDFLSVITLGENKRGIHKLEQREGKPAERHRLWLDKTVSIYEGRILPNTAAMAQRWGELSFRLGNVNPDLFIAATALEHDLTVVTRNTRRFEPTGAKLLNPYSAA
jgi:toxin FitB